MQVINLANKIFKGVLFLLLGIFFVMIITCSNGYYEYELNKKTNLTNESILQFEKDLKAGKNIDINNYVKTDTKNYDNKVSRIGNNISKKVDNIMSTGIKYLFKYIEKSINLDD